MTTQDAPLLVHIIIITLILFVIFLLLTIKTIYHEKENKKAKELHDRQGRNKALKNFIYRNFIEN